MASNTTTTTTLCRRALAHRFGEAALTIRGRLLWLRLWLKLTARKAARTRAWPTSENGKTALTVGRQEGIVVALRRLQKWIGVACGEPALGIRRLLYHNEQGERRLQQPHE